MTYQTDHPLRTKLLDVDRAGIEREDNQAIDAFFAPEFVFHGSDATTDRDGLKAYFASLRAAFPDLSFDRREIVVADDHLASRTTVTGTFANRFTASPIGAVEPTGRRVEWEVLNLIRFDADGRAVEEWVQTDSRALLRALGVDQASIADGVRTS